MPYLVDVRNFNSSSLCQGKDVVPVIIVIKLPFQAIFSNFIFRVEYQTSNVSRNPEGTVSANGNVDQSKIPVPSSCCDSD